MKRNAVLLLIVLSGCGILSRSKSTFYSLERIPPTAPVVARIGSPVGIDVLELPPGLERKDVVVRKAGNQADIRGNEQWTASFDTVVLHTLAFDLADRMPAGMVVLPGAMKPLGAMRGIDVVFAELAAGPQARVLLEARWTLRNGTTTAFTQDERIEVPISSLDSKSVATGVSQALAELADRIAARL